MDDQLIHLLNTGSFTGIVIYLAAQWLRQRRNDRNGSGNPNGNTAELRSVNGKLETLMADSLRRFDTVHKRLDLMQDRQSDHGERLSKIEGHIEEVLAHVRRESR